MPPLPPHRRSSRGGLSSRRTAGHRGGGNAGSRGPRGGGTALVCPLVDIASAGIHEEVADRGQLQAELLGDGDLQFLGRTVVLPEDGHKGAPLQVSEHQPGSLRALVALHLALLLLLSLAGWKHTDKRHN